MWPAISSSTWLISFSLSSLEQFFLQNVICLLKKVNNSGIINAFVSNALGFITDKMPGETKMTKINLTGYTDFMSANYTII